MSGKRSARGSSFTRKVRDSSAVSVPAQKNFDEFVLVAVIEDPATPEAVTLVAYHPDDVDLAAEQFPGKETRILDRDDVLSEYAQVIARASLALALSDGRRDGFIVGTADGVEPVPTLAPQHLLGPDDKHILDALRNHPEGLTPPELSEELDIPRGFVDIALMCLLSHRLVILSSDSRRDTADYLAYRAAEPEQ